MSVLAGQWLLFFLATTSETPSCILFMNFPRRPTEALECGLYSSLLLIPEPVQILIKDRRYHHKWGFEIVSSVFCIIFVNRGHWINVVVVSFLIAAHTRR